MSRRLTGVVANGQRRYGLCPRSSFAVPRTTSIDISIYGPPMKPNRMKAKLHSGQAVFGCSVMFPSPQIVEMLGHAGFDWVLLDCEHGSLAPADVEVMAMAADAAGITAIARPRTNANSDIQSAMDRGVMGVQIPHVNTAEDARRVVAAVKFGPGAGRGLAAGTRPDNWGLGAKMADFTAAANDQSLICVQIEHETAIANVADILQVEGIDVFFIGPSDLSQSMGYPGEPKAPPVAAAIAQAQRQIIAAHKTLGMPATTDNLGELVGLGVRYIYTHLPRLLGAGAAAFLKAAQGTR
jgi:4-hydroxy-2-oxoheptanedioate aldolase